MMANKTIHDLSSEVIAYIFECAIDSTVSRSSGLFKRNHEKTSISETSTLKSPLFFGKICSAWREIAWSTPSLWGTIIITLNLSQDHSTSQLDILRQWLERSKSVPLDISLTFQFVNPNKDRIAAAASTLEALKLLIPHVEKWRSASLHILDLASLEILNNVRSRLHSLTFLCLRVQDFPTPDFDPLDTFQEAPLLRSVTIVALPTHLPWTFPWKQLTDLHIIFPQMDDYFNVLRQCSTLCNLRLTDPPPSLFDQDPNYVPLSSPIVHTMLKSLTIDVEGHPCFFFSDTGFIDMMNAATLPALQEFHIIMGRELLPQSFEAINSLIIRSECVLRSLTIWDLETEPRNRIRTPSNIYYKADIDAPPGSLLEENTDDSHLIRLLRGSPCLTHLHLITYIPVKPDRLMYNRFFTEIRKNNAFLPNLQAFKFNAPMVFDEKIFLGFLTDRWIASVSQGISRLSHVDLYLGIYEDLSVETIRALQQLSADGLELKLIVEDHSKRVYARYRDRTKDVFTGQALKMEWAGWGYYEALLARSPIRPTWYGTESLYKLGRNSTIVLNYFPPVPT